MNLTAIADGDAYVSLRGAVHIAARPLRLCFSDAAGWLLNRGSPAALNGYVFRPNVWAPSAQMPSKAPPSIRKTLTAWSNDSKTDASQELAGWRLADLATFLRGCGLTVDDGVIAQSCGDLQRTDAKEQPFFYSPVAGRPGLVRGNKLSDFPRLYTVALIPSDAENVPPASSTVDHLPDDLLPIVAHVRREFWSGPFDPSNQKSFSSQVAIRGWLAEHYPEVSEARRRAVEVVACPFNRDRSKL